MEGKRAGFVRARDIIKPDIPTCALTDHVDDVRFRVQAAGWNECVVINDQRVVLGFVNGETLNSNTQSSAEQVMESGPATIRPNLTRDEVISYIDRHKSESILVTNSEGQLLGIIFRAEVEGAALQADRPSKNKSRAA